MKRPNLKVQLPVQCTASERKRDRKKERGSRRERGGEIRERERERGQINKKR